MCIIYYRQTQVKKLLSEETFFFLRYAIRAERVFMYIHIDSFFLCAYSERRPPPKMNVMDVDTSEREKKN